MAASIASSGVTSQDGQQHHLLEEALNVVKVQSTQMKRCLDSSRLMDGLKHCSTMLAELRTSSLTPKSYYELYMSVFDALRHLSNYLYEAHTTGKHHLADLYELVQYAGNVVPRLYLMITVGSVYMSMDDAPVREIMRDLIEMSRGVQHPTRGLFLRHYLSGATRDHLPQLAETHPDAAQAGSLQDSIGFVLTNFIEMNKLWVRMQHQGHSREREKRENERKELRILVGTNLVRLSQLEGVDLGMYLTTILPSILEQVVMCKDVIAQEYLMEVIIQVFPDEFHLHTLGEFLHATAQLHPKVNIKDIVIALINRLAAYAAREAENDSPEEVQRQEEEISRRLNERMRKQRIARAIAAGHDISPEDREDVVSGKGKEVLNDAHSVNGNLSNGGNGQKRFRGIPEDVKLFEVFWEQVVQLITARVDLTLQEVTALMVAMMGLSLSCYPDRLEYVDQVLEYASAKSQEQKDSIDVHDPSTTKNFLLLLKAPIESYRNVLTVLALTTFLPLLSIQSLVCRKEIAKAIISSILKHQTVIENPEDVDALLDICQVLIRVQKDQSTNQNRVKPYQNPYQFGVGLTESYYRPTSTTQADPEEVEEEQTWLAKMIHLFRSKSLDRQFALLQVARKHFQEGGTHIRYTFPPLIVSTLRLASRWYREQGNTKTSEEDNVQTQLPSLFRFIHQIITVLYHRVECSNVCLRLFLLAGQVSDESMLEDLAYEFYVQAFTIYEESISESKAQFQAITLITGSLQNSRIFSADNYDTLITKTALHSAKLIKKPDQCRAVYQASHLWWQTASRAPSKDRQLLKDGKRVLECLQKALKIADACMDAVTSIELFVEILNQYIYFYQNRNTAITIKYINGLIDLINRNLTQLDDPDQHPPSSTSSALLMAPAAVHDLQGMGAGMAREVLRHFNSTKQYIKSLQEPRKVELADDNPSEDESSNQAAREAAEAAQEMEAKRWEGINV